MGCDIATGCGLAVEVHIISLVVPVTYSLVRFDRISVSFIERFMIRSYTRV